ncbi:formimidoylglutamase [Halococcus morrhuae DSM 1307]|uniref:Formimidoylglutamase n=1 Tax=Halococcus morrhuae DSM 1307 TaxID=931277 RepID=M0MDU2_HALMO|nr:formimidoylglutamase [Halococcus morrhuae]EMA43488.1 formimidoylglutamase [Halococcus morrhuae DSM 1307]
MSLREPPTWDGPSGDPDDEQFGDIVEPTTLDDASEFDAVFIGEPYDGAVIGRRGAREGPGALREALAGVKTHRFGAGPVRSVGDLGDVEVPDGDVSTVQEAILETTHEIHASDALPVSLGGDNSLTYPNAAPLLEGALGVINFDAHLDCREVHGEPTSGSPYRQLHEAGLDAYACVGARHFETSTAYADYIDDQGGEIVTSEAVGDDIESAVERALDAMAGVETIYVSVDLDVLDAAAAPGVSAPTPGGITTRELFRMLRATAGDDRVAGFEIVECAPPLDAGAQTAAAGARAIAHFLSGYNGDSP